MGIYELFQQAGLLEDEVWWKMLRGLTTRNYPLVTRSFAQAYGIEKSATSERFIRASRDKLKELMERPLGELKLCAMVIDGTPVQGSPHHRPDCRANSPQTAPPRTAPTHPQ